MASVTLTADGRWSDGTSVSAYPARQQAINGAAPSGSPSDTATVSGGVVSFSDLPAGVPHVAWAGGVGVRFMAVDEFEQVLAPERGLRTRVDELARRASIPSAGDLPELSADTGVPVRYIALLASNTVKAIPADTPEVATPTGLGVTARLSSVRVAWDSVPTATSYRVYRDGSLLRVVTARSLRDLTIGVGNTYSYQVQAEDFYGQRSALTSPVTAFIDPALNVAPTVEVTAWPATFPTNGRTLLRVNAADANAHALELALGVDTGTLEETDDPSVWLYTP